MVVYKNGDILTSTADAICHQVNCKGVMGAGLAKQIKQKYPTVFAFYKARCDEDARARKISGISKSGLLGLAQVCYKENYRVGEVKDKQMIVNLFAQDGYGRDRQYTDYDALRVCLKNLSRLLSSRATTIAVPYQMGCGLGGGDWNIVLPIVEEELASYTIEVWKYNK